MNRKEFLRKPFLLPADVLLFPVAELAEHLREKLDCAEGDYAVTRPHMRSFSRIVDPATAALLEEFRQPTALIEAILRHSRTRGLDPHVLLESAFPILQAFTAATFLVPADSPLAQSVVASFAPGQIVAGYEVRRLVQVLEDSEVYQAKAENGAIVALKLTRRAPDELQLRSFVREAAILEHLAGVHGPRLIEYGAYRERTFLATSWIAGIPIGRRAQELRGERVPGQRDQLHRLCCHLLDAYCALHERGVIHGDVHPSNIIVDSDDAIYILDFGLARMLSRPDLDHNHRAGLAWYMEPELARAILAEEQLPKSSLLGEQYATAALIYYLLCGAYYLSAAPERTVLYRQVLEAASPPFTRNGVSSWPGIEEVLARALAKAPTHRYKTMGAFRDAFSRMHRSGEHSGRNHATKFVTPDWVPRLVKRVVEPCTLELLYPEPPRASIYFGAGGLIWFLYRSALLHNDPQRSAVADLWLRRTLDRMGKDDGFGTPQATNPPTNNVQASLYLGRSGLHLLSALVGNARGDFQLCTQHMAQLMETDVVIEESPELLFGRSGHLVGGALLLNALGWSQKLDLQPFARGLWNQSQQLWATWQAYAKRLDEKELPHLGIAHGWAGILYAQLLLHRALNRPIADDALAALDALAARAEPHGRGVAWLGTLQHPGQTGETPSYAPGWCSGSAGYLYLWTVAAEMTNDERYLELAEKAAWHSWEHDDRNPNLCCGLTGRAFALLRYYRYTGDDLWLLRARQLAHLALDIFGKTVFADSRTYSLYRGALGAALLASELDYPERAVMPLFEPEGWPPAELMYTMDQPNTSLDKKETSHEYEDCDGVGNHANATTECLCSSWRGACGRTCS